VHDSCFEESIDGLCPKVFSVSSMKKEKIAIIGAGLAGCLLAARVKTFAQVTLYERGNKRRATDGKVVSVGHPIGMRTTCYGLGGTTNVWRGCMLSMRPDEYKTEHWPASVRQELVQHASDVLHLLCPTTYSTYLNARSAHATFPTDEIIIPNRPPRLRLSGLIQGLEIKTNRVVQHIEETGSKTVVHSTDGGMRFWEDFDRVIVAAGGLNSPLLLLRSGLGGPSVGRNLTDHPAGFVAKISSLREYFDVESFAEKDGRKPVFKIKDSDTGLWSMLQLCPTKDLRFDEDYLDSYRVAPAVRLTKAIKRIGPRRVLGRSIRSAKGRDRDQRPQGHASVLLFTEQEALGQGEVSEDRDGTVHVDWRCSKQSVAAAERSLESFAKQIGAQLHRPSRAMIDSLWSAAHHWVCRRKSKGARQ